MNVVWAQIWIMLVLIISTAPAFAQNDISAACRLALTTREERVESIAKRLARASELTDLRQKDQQLRLLQREIIDLQKTHGQQVIKEIAQRASTLQALAPRTSIEESKQMRATETKALSKWTHLKVLLPNFEGEVVGRSDKLLSVEHRKLKILDLNKPTHAPREIQLDEIDPENSYLVSVPTANTLMAVRTDESNEVSLNSRIDLQSGQVTHLPNLNDSFKQMAPFPDGAFLVDQFRKPYLFHSPQGAPVETSLVTKPNHSGIVTFPSTSRYAVLNYHEVRFKKIFDRQSLKFIDVQTTADTLLESAVFDPISQRFLAIRKKKSGVNVSATGELVEIDPKTGVVKARDTTLKDISSLVLSGDFARVIISYSSQSKPHSTIYDLSNGNLTQVEGALGDIQVQKVQDNGPLAFILKPTDGRWIPYILDTKSGATQQIHALDRKPAKNVVISEFSSDGKKLWLSFLYDPQLYELE